MRSVPAPIFRFTLTNSALSRSMAWKSCWVGPARGTTQPAAPRASTRIGAAFISSPSRIHTRGRGRLFREIMRRPPASQLVVDYPAVNYRQDRFQLLNCLVGNFAGIEVIVAEHDHIAQLARLDGA